MKKRHLILYPKAPSLQTRGNILVEDPEVCVCVNWRPAYFYRLLQATCSRSISSLSQKRYDIKSQQQLNVPEIESSAQQIQPCVSWVMLDWKATSCFITLQLPQICASKMSGVAWEDAGSVWFHRPTSTFLGVRASTDPMRLSDIYYVKVMAQSQTEQLQKREGSFALIWLFQKFKTYFVIFLHCCCCCCCTYTTVQKVSPWGTYYFLSPNTWR